MKKRWLTWLLVLAVCLSLPPAAMASGETDTAEAAAEEQTESPAAAEDAPLPAADGGEWELVDAKSGNQYGDASVPYGESAVLTAAIRGDAADVSCQWYTVAYYLFIPKETKIDGAVDLSYTTAPVAAPVTYMCRATDGDGTTAEAYFDVTVDNGLRVWDPETDSSYSDRTVEYGQSVTLTAETEAYDAEGLTYRWYVYKGSEDGYEMPEEIKGAEGSSYVTDSIAGAVRYRCTVTDKYKNREDVDYFISVASGLEAWTEDGEEKTSRLEKRFPKGAEPVLSVSASAGEGAGPLTYAWYAFRQDEEGIGWWRTEEPIEGADSPSYTVPPLTAPAFYMCEVSDRYGNTREVDFLLKPENHFTAKPEAAKVLAEYGREATLRIVASADEGPVAYQWYTAIVSEYGYTEMGEPIDGEESAVLTITAEKTGSYYCRVSDPYETEEIQIDVEIDNGLTAYVRGTKQDHAEIHVPYGQMAELALDAACSAGPLTYLWKHAEQTEDGWSDLVPVPDADGPSLVTVPVTKLEEYFCRVTDRFGTERDVWFEVYVEDGFTVEADGAYTVLPVDYIPGTPVPDDPQPVDVCHVYAQPGATVALSVKATSASGGEFLYSWFGLPELIPVEGEQTSTLTLTDVRESRYYTVNVRNAYGEMKNVFFRVVVDDRWDANHDNAVNAADAAAFLAGRQYGDAAKLLRMLVGLPA